MNAKCLIARSDTFSIPGGWTLKHPALNGQTITGRSPDDAVATLAAMFRVNGIEATDDQLWDFANADWGQRVIAAGDKDRWLGAPFVAAAVAGPVGVVAPAASVHLRRILTPKDTGPALWGTLHLIPLAVPWSKDAWMGHIAVMTKLIEPGGYESGCRLCAGHWKAFREANPPERVNDAKAAADWSLRAHNAASKHAGHPTWTWREAAAKWGWPGEWE